jgi:small subunit ribosomal protein S27Ae
MTRVAKKPMPRKTQPRRRNNMARYEMYDEDGETDHEQCQRCGDAFLADHGDRLHCGKCGYTEWQ